MLIVRNVPPVQRQELDAGGFMRRRYLPVVDRHVAQPGFQFSGVLRHEPVDEICRAVEGALASEVANEVVRIFIEMLEGKIREQLISGLTNRIALLSRQGKFSGLRGQGARH
jgi:hypothetical protein